MQSKNKAIQRKEEEKKDKAFEPSGPQKVASLISKLDEAKTKIDELTKVLSNCPDKTEEDLIEEMAEAKREAVSGAAAQSAQGAGASTT